MVTSQSQKTPQIFKTVNDHCSFIRRVLPGGHLMELNRVFHDNVVILAFTGSSWLSRQSGRSYVEAPGCVVLRDAGQVFDTKTVSCDELNGAQCREIHISPTDIGTLLEQGDAVRIPPFDFTNPVIEDARIHDKLVHTHDVFENGNCALMRSSCLAILLREIAEISNNISVEITSKPCRKRYENIIDYMREHYDEEITLQHLSELSQINPFVLLRQFRNECGVTPHQYLRTYRVNRAMDFIQQGVKLADVAQLCGFSDQSHMNRQFKKTVGVSPGRFIATVAEERRRSAA